MDKLLSLIAQNRFGLGPTLNDTNLVDADPKNWVRSQVKKHPLPQAFSKYESSDEMLLAGLKAHRFEQAGKRALRREQMQNFQAEMLTRTKTMASSKNPFAERLVMFWSNHFTVSSTNSDISPILGAFEREAIRPYIFGKFENMLVATTKHVAMLSYLNNTSSVGSTSRFGKRRDRTINEDLAHAILELHTLGTNGGHSEQDITVFAEAISGWSHGGLFLKNRADIAHGRFEFYPALHEPGDKEFMGRTYKGIGIQDGIAILKDLSLRTATAKNIATKLVQHFVDDVPPQSAINKIADVFLKTKGDLTAVSLALIDLPEIWSTPLTKTKTPHELIVSMLKATGTTSIKRNELRSAYEAMEQVPFAAPTPAGWPDLAEYWTTPKAVKQRLTWIKQIAPKLPTDLKPMDVLEKSLGALASEETRANVEKASTAEDGLVALFSSAEFQRR